MKESKTKDFITLAFAGEAEWLKTLTDQLDQCGLDKREEGKRGGSEGHCIQYYDGDKPLFFAMIHSNQHSYLVRADKNLFEAA